MARRIGLAVGVTVVISLATPGLAVITAGAVKRSTYVVQAASVAEARSAVDGVGGRVGLALPIVDGVEAELNPSQFRALHARHAVGVTPDVGMHFLGSSFGAGDQTPQLARMDVNGLWSPSAGQGVGVALIDTGVAMTPGIPRSHLVVGPNFSSSADNLDRYGHGTFMAGLIAGHATQAAGSVPGVAPGATLVSVKVAGDDGSTTLGQVIQGIGWAVANRARYGIRVLSISFG
ncbi:MAG TPA: S8 family serine peptidase, partial [Acidimicrobiales bacterium]|nr:S8 family serine peptidase [Acidimicrobiales bacterium]